MTTEIQDRIDRDTEVEFAAHDPQHDQAVPAIAQYTPVDHLSHFIGLGVSTFYLVAAVLTLWEVVSRYLFNAPTLWAFEIVMVLCAAAWILSSEYITLKKRHIGITVLHVLASPQTRCRLDLVAMLVGIAALYLLLTDAAIRDYGATESVEKTGSAFNSPMPMMLKSLLMLGGFLYLARLTVNLHRDVTAPAATLAVKLLAAAMTIYFVTAAGAYGGAGLHRSARRIFARRCRARPQRRARHALLRFRHDFGHHGAAAGGADDDRHAARHRDADRLGADGDHVLRAAWAVSRLDQRGGTAGALHARRDPVLRADGLDPRARRNRPGPLRRDVDRCRQPARRRRGADRRRRRDPRGDVGRDGRRGRHAGTGGAAADVPRWIQPQASA